MRATVHIFSAKNVLNLRLFMVKAGPNSAPGRYEIGIRCARHEKIYGKPISDWPNTICKGGGERSTQNLIYMVTENILKSKHFDRGS
jgi:hypothetical protein